MSALTKWLCRWPKLPVRNEACVRGFTHEKLRREETTNPAPWVRTPEYCAPFKERRTWVRSCSRGQQVLDHTQVTQSCHLEQEV